jgi:hypothetical protein
MTPVQRKTLVGWALAGGIALAAMAIGYGLGRAGDERPGALAESDGADVGPWGGDEAAPLETAAGRDDGPGEPGRIGSGGSATAGGLRPGERVAVEVPEEVEGAEPLQPELVREPAEERGWFGGSSEVVTLPAGTPLRVRLHDGVSSQTAQVGDRFRAELAEPLVADGRSVFPAGTEVEGRVVLVQPLRKIGGRAQLGIAFDRLLAGGDELPIEASWSRVGKSETPRDAATIAGGAVAGAVIGNQAKKNDRGKIIGSILGAGAGAAVASKTRGDTIELPVGTELEVTLADSVVATIDR